MEKSFAQQMLEQLSDNVSNLILTVLELKDKNAKIPVVEITAIANASSSIADIAIKLADSEYSRYPIIYNEIIKTTSNMSNIKNQTINAISNFSSNNNKQQAWSNLTTSCKNIANETYKILKVIYDADIKRLKYLIDECKMSFKRNENSFSMIDREEFTEFGELIQNTISNIIEYSEYVGVKAVELSECLLISDEIEEINNLSKELIEEGNKLIDIVNDIFNDTDDPSQKDKFLNHQLSLIQRIDTLFKLIESNSQTLTIPEFTNINHIIQSPIPSQYSITNSKFQHNLIEQPQDSTNDEEEEDLLNKLIRGISKSCIEEFRATCRKDPIATETISNSITQLTPILNDTVNQWLNNNSNGNHNKELIKQSLHRLNNDLIPKYLQLARLITSGASEQSNIDSNEMIELLDSIQDCLLNSIGGEIISKESQFLNTIKAKEDVLNILSDHSIGENTSAIIGTLKHLAKNQTQLESIIENSNGDGDGNEEINEAVSKLSQLLPLQIKAAKLYLKDCNNPDARKQFTDISDSMKVPLSKIISLMEPNKHTDSNEILAKQKCSTQSLIDAANIGNTKLLEELLTDLENGNASLISLLSSELLLLDDNNQDPLLQQLVKLTTDQLLEQCSKRRTLLNKLLKKPNDKEIIDEIFKNNQDISNLSKSLSDCLKSFETLPLLKLQLIQSIESNNQPKLQSVQKDINNRINAITYNNNNQNENDHQIKQLQSFQNQLNNELSSIPQSIDNLNYIFDNIINNIPLNSNINNNNNNEIILEEEEEEVLLLNQENEKKREIEKEIEFKELEKLSNDQKFLKLFNDLIQNLKNSEANKSMLTLKQLISEQDKLIQLANEIKEKSTSKHFKDQIDASISLFKNSISLSIGLAGKGNSANGENLTKAIKTVKKSIIELTHLLKLNPSIEELSNWYGRIGNADLLLINDGIINGFSEHQINSRYYIQTAYEVDKDDLISQSIEKIVFQQSELLKLATDYLVSPNCLNLDTNLKLLLANSLQTVKKLIVDQVESALSFLENKKQQPEESIDKLLTILDTVRESVENCSKSIFNNKPSTTISQDIINQSINSILPSLTLNSTKFQSNPNNKQLESEYQQLLDQIIQPLEQLILNPNIKIEGGSGGDDKLDHEDDDEDDEIKKIKKLINDEKKELDKLESNALDSDSKGVVESSRALVKLHQEILLMSDTADNDNNEIIKECTKELTSLIPLQLQTIKAMLQSKDIPTESLFQKKVSNINNQIKRNLNEIENQLLFPNNNNNNNTTPYYRDEFKKLSKIIDNNGMVIKDENQFKNNLKKLEKLGKKCVDSANLELSKSVNYMDSDKQKRIRDAIEDLEKRLNNKNNSSSVDGDLSSRINQFLKSPLNPVSRQQFEKARNNFEKSLDKVIDESLLINTPIQLLINHKNLIQKLTRQSVNSNYGTSKVQETTKQILENYQKLKSQLIDTNNNTTDQLKKSIILNSLKEIESITPKLIIASNNCAASSSVSNDIDSQKKRELLENLSTTIESPIAEILHQLDQIDQVYKFEDIIKLHQSTLSKLNDTIDDGNNENQVTELISQLSKIQSNTLIPFLKQQNLLTNNNNNNNEEIENQLKSKLLDVETLSRDYLKNLKNGTLTENIKAEKDISISSLRNLINSLYSNKIPELQDKRDKSLHQSQLKSKNIQQLVANIKSNNLLPIADSPNKIEKFVTIQTNTLNPVFSKHRVTSTASVNQKPKSATTASTTTPKPISISKPIETRAPVKLNTNTTTNTSAATLKPTTTQVAAVAKVTPIPNNKVITLEDSCINAANQISNSDNRQVGEIGKELEIYAKAIKDGDKKQLLICSRNISSLLNKYSIEISTISKSSTNKMMQSRLSHCVGVVQTLSCQFKILTSVKAASDEHDSDSDSQLSSMVSQLTLTLLDINTSVNTVNKFNIKK